jgi:hypothetical protein
MYIFIPYTIPIRTTGYIPYAGCIVHTITLRYSALEQYAIRESVPVASTVEKILFGGLYEKGS